MTSSRTLLCSLLALALAIPALASGDTAPDTSRWKALGAPYVTGNSDEGVRFGLLGGYSRPPGVYLAAQAGGSTRGGIDTQLEGEVDAGRWRIAGKINYRRAVWELYPAGGADPDPEVRVTVENPELKLSALRRWGERLEIGPAVWVEHVKGLDPVDPASDSPLELARIPRLRPATLGLAGARVRYGTAHPVRPVKGWLVDLITQAGAADYAGWAGPRFDATLQAMALGAAPLGPHLRFGARAETRLQLETPPPLRNYVGGEKKVRGEPYRRDAGRRVILGRAELAVVLTRRLTFPLLLARKLIPSMPLWPLHVELVPFWDVGAAGDPDFGWRKTRIGYGAGLRVVIPPDMVVRLDVGTSPGSGPRIYMGLGSPLVP